jgi:type II secretory pathway predicted ATPase ExeA
MNKQLISRFGIKFNPFRPGIPIEAILPSPAVEAFCRRVEFSIGDGGFVMVTGEPGTGKSIVLRQLAHQLEKQRDVIVGTIDHPQSQVTDFYRELGDQFGVKFVGHNRWDGFKSLRLKWSDHISSSMTRPIIIIDEAQEMLSTVFNELRILSSKNFDSEHLLCVVFAGDHRLPSRLRHPDLLPLDSRIRRRLQLEPALPAELLNCLEHVLETAGNPALMTSELKMAISDHANGNYRVMMNMGDELLAAAAEQGNSVLDEKLFLEVFTPPKRKNSSRKKTS